MPLLNQINAKQEILRMKFMGQIFNMKYLKPHILQQLNLPFNIPKWLKIRLAPFTPLLVTTELICNDLPPSYNNIGIPNL